MVTDVILPIALFLMMSGMGLSLEIIDFRRILEYPKAAIIGIASMLILIPALGFAIATCASLSPEMAVGLILVATCPGGMFSNLLTHFGKANLALSVGMTAFVSSIYVFSIPFWTRFALEQFAAESTHVAPPIEKTIVPLFLFVLVPLAVGMFVRSRNVEFAKRREGHVKNVSAFLVVLIFIYLGFAQEDTIADDSKQVFPAVLILNLASVTVAVSLAVIGRLSRKDGLAIVIEHAIRQEGTAIYVAVTVIGSAQMALPLMINGSIGMGIGLTFLAMFGGDRPLITRLRAYLESRSAESS
jgi:BASS family bile acid:Na+ symporter